MRADIVEPVRLAAGLYAVHRLIGPYALIASIFKALHGGWLPQSGYTPDTGRRSSRTETCWLPARSMRASPIC